MSGPIRARVFNGTRDIMPEEMIPRNRILRVITDVFEKYGFAPLETPVMEYLDVLTAKSGEESLKLIYPLAYKGGDVLGLKFDLTVPLARMVAMRPELVLPFKRYQIQPVYRAERAQPAQGRYREFHQCDVDTIGTESLIADAENIAVCHEIYETLGVGDEAAGLRMRVNNRKLLRAMVAAAGLEAGMDQAVCTALDKIDKIGREKVEELLGEAGVDAEARAALFALIDLGAEIGPTNHDALLAALEEKLGGIDEGRQGLDEMRELFDHVVALGVPAGMVEFDLVLTRGLDYYTGPIYEFYASKLESFGSLGGGGRYDDLIGVYCGRPTPATGVCVGLSRLQGAMMKLGLIDDARSAPTQALVLAMGDAPAAGRLALGATLRAAGIPAETYYEAARFKKQIQYAERKGIPFVLIQGPDELERGVVQVKDIRVGEQTEVAVDALVGWMRDHLDSD